MVLRTLVVSLLAVGVTAVTRSPQPIAPGHDSAKENANSIFNAIHSAGRQWGSSLHHNGFGFFPAIMPRGTLLYHGARHNRTPAGLEWLAFEMEHAEAFAGSMRGHLRPPGPGRRPDNPEKPLENEREELKRREEEEEEEEKIFRGYLHVYQANRDLNLLLIDGMSAGKTTMGTLDSQDLLLLEKSTGDGNDSLGEWPRAEGICDLVTGWGYDGVVRLEIGFEVIYCNFSTGIDLVSMTRSIMPEDKIGGRGMTDVFGWTRAVAERYDGIGGDRLRIDYSSMVSALFFPINISSTDVDRPDLVRLAAASMDELRDVKTHLREVAVQPRRFTVNWQALVDMIISRYSKRLAALGSTMLPLNHFVEEVDTITQTWLDMPALPNDVTLAQRNRTAEAIDRCRKHFLRPARIFEEDWSREDELIFTAVDAVMAGICNVLFDVRSTLLEAKTQLNDDRTSREDDTELEKAVAVSRARIQNLMGDLAWTTWKQPQPCAVDEVLFIAMWPYGDVDDHWHPGCRSIDRMRQTGYSYWQMMWLPSDDGS